MGTANQNLDINPKIEDLPFSYSSIRAEPGRRPIGFRFTKHIINIVANLDGIEIVATGEGDSIELARARARSELLERSALLKFGRTLGSNTSNGWAAHLSEDLARTHAIYELVERDAVLANWYKRVPFLELDPDSWPNKIKEWVKSELSRSEFPRLRILLSTEGLGPSVTVIFENDVGLGVSAHSSKETLEQSIESAISEACRPAHSSIRKDYWNESFSIRAGNRVLQEPNVHSLYYAYHEAFPSWMFGSFVNYESAEKIWSKRIEEVLSDKLFSFDLVMNEPIFIGFARHPEAIELRWGNTDLKWVLEQVASKRLGLNENNINNEVHIVA